VTVLEIRRWKAFLRLNGETLVERDEDILNEFKGFVQALKRAGIDYSVVVNVEEGGIERLASRARQDPSITSSPSPGKRVESIGD
jgi:hypothetical protein